MDRVLTASQPLHQLLDWSENPLVGLFFATESNHEHDTRDGQLYALDPRALNIEAGDPSPGHPRLLNDGDPELASYLPEAGGAKKNPRAVLAPMVFDRIRFQTGTFTAHQSADPLVISTEMHKSQAVESYTIRANSKARIREQLDILGVNEVSIYRDLDRISKEVNQFFLKA